MKFDKYFTKTEWVCKKGEHIHILGLILRLTLLTNLLKARIFSSFPQFSHKKKTKGLRRKISQQ